MEDLTRLERVIEATAEAETDLQPETRLEKVIIDTGAKIQQEISEGGKTLYMHNISMWVQTKSDKVLLSVYFALYNNSEAPIEFNDLKTTYKDKNLVFSGYMNYFVGSTTNIPYGFKLKNTAFSLERFQTTDNSIRGDTYFYSDMSTISVTDKIIEL